MTRVLLALMVVACHHEPPHVSVGVAASLRYAMPDVVAAYEKKSGVTIDVTYGASDAIGDQLAHGAALDALVVADAVALDRQIAARTIDESSRREVATNAIVLIGPPGSTPTFATLATLHVGTKIAIGDPATVPVGRYAKQYLESLGEWSTLEPQLIYGGDVAGVLALAKQGRARLAVVYRTDARAAAPLVVLDDPPDAPKASVVAGIATHSKHAAAARAFTEFLASPEGHEILARYGFGPPRS
ncbi:MAG TPA: molybdate ABC transporter substrate-binding protein [Kofleriaceae bacterium]|nr:molybdate ABC transporter substrate-binding protein [Kofleriaceae bacterium]